MDKSKSTYERVIVRIPESDRPIVAEIDKIATILGLSLSEYMRLSLYGQSHLYLIIEKFLKSKILQLDAGEYTLTDICNITYTNVMDIVNILQYIPKPALRRIMDNLEKELDDYIGDKDINITNDKRLSKIKIVIS